MNNESDEDNIRRVYLKLLHSGLFEAYQKAFVRATSLPLVLRFVDDPARDIKVESENQSAFCRLLNKGSACEQCVLHMSCLEEKAREGTQSIRCFTGMEETAIPVRYGRKTIAFLETGQVFFKKPTKTDFTPVARALVDSGFEAKEIERLREAFLEGAVIEEDRYRSTVTLLKAFALQLGEIANRIVLEQQGAEPAVVRRAKEFILSRLGGPIRLRDVAEHVHVSSFYFCKLFKQATGITFTEFVNRQRVERAKQRLLNPELQITEAAYDVGFQSLSQFNRSFLKIVGESPTAFRRRMKIKPELARV